MTRSIITFAAAAAAALALAGCSAGINTQTASQVAPVPGYSESFPATDPLISVRNAHMNYPGPEGYAAGSDATVKIWLFNDSEAPVQVTLSSDAGTITPSVPITIPPGGFAAPEIQLTSLRQAVVFGQSVDLKVDFAGVHEFNVPLSIAPPSVPVPGSKLEVTGEAEEGH